MITSQSSADLDERDYREKNHWRRWVWNRISERVDISAKDAQVIYLPASHNLDAVEADRRGFLRRNLIPVDRSSKKIASLRENGILCIKGDILDVARLFGEELHVLYFDFCCGGEMDLLGRITDLLFSQHVRNSVVALNFLRGRDASSNEYRSELQSLAEKLGEPFPGTLHRGYMAYALLIARLAGALHLGGAEMGVSAKTLKMAGNHLHSIIRNRCPYIKASYRSTTNQTFDTVVFKNPLSVLGDMKFIQDLPDSLMDKRTRHRIAAFKAHRTRNHQK